jgi:hypothetical protein
LQHKRVEWGERTLYGISLKWAEQAQISAIPDMCPALDVFRTLNLGEIRQELEEEGFLARAEVRLAA